MVVYVMEHRSYSRQLNSDPVIQSLSLEWIIIFMKKTFNLWSFLGDQEENDTEEFFMDSRKPSKEFEMFKVKICKSDWNMVHLQRYFVR